VAANQGARDKAPRVLQLVGCKGGALQPAIRSTCPMPPVGQVGQVLNLQVHGRQVNLNLNLGFFFARRHATNSQPHPDPCLGWSNGWCLPSQAHRLAGPTINRAHKAHLHFSSNLFSSILRHSS
jgi:hypothetical protein